MNTRLFTTLVIVTLIAAALSPTGKAQAGGVQMLPPTDFSGNTCSPATSGLLQWDGSTSIKCIPNTMGLSNGYVGIGTTNPGGQLEVRSGADNRLISAPAISFNPGMRIESVNDAYNADEPFEFRGSIFTFTNTGFELMRITGSGNVGIGSSAPIGTLDVENGQNTATICLNGKCTPTAFNPATCHMVTDEGGPPDYISDARCASGEFLLTGGGRAEVPGSDLCGGTEQGFLHTSAPDGDLMGWSVDAYSNTWTGDVCTEAYAVCCGR